MDRHHVDYLLAAAGAAGLVGASRNCARPALVAILPTVHTSTAESVATGLQFHTLVLLKANGANLTVFFVILAALRLTAEICVDW